MLLVFSPASVIKINSVASDFLSSREETFFSFQEKIARLHMFTYFFRHCVSNNTALCYINQLSLTVSPTVYMDVYVFKYLPEFFCNVEHEKILSVTAITAI